MKPKCLSLVAILLVIASGEIADGENVAARDLDLATLQWQGLKDARDRLQSGIFQASGRDLCSSPDSDSALTEFPVGSTCAFDYDAKFLRFDRTTVGLLRRKDPSGRTVRVDAEGIYIMRPEHIYCWTNLDS